MLRRAGSVLMKLLIGICWITLFVNFCVRMQRFEEQQFDESVLVGIDIRRGHKQAFDLRNPRHDAEPLDFHIALAVRNLERDV